MPPEWNSEVTVEVPATVADGTSGVLTVEAVDMDDPDAKCVAMA